MARPIRYDLNGEVCNRPDCHKMHTHGNPPTITELHSGRPVTDDGAGAWECGCEREFPSIYAWRLHADAAIAAGKEDK